MGSNLILIFSFSIATFLIGFLMIPSYIGFLQNMKFGKEIRKDATMWKATQFYKLHKKKAGTPTMWGAIILAVVFFMVLVSFILQQLDIITYSLINQKETYLSLFTLATVGFLGMVDDYMNIKWIGRTKGLSAKFKMLWLLLFATLGALWFYFNLNWSSNSVAIPFLEYGLSIGIWFIPLFIFIIVAFSNSVNITDGLDGLAWWLLLFAYAIYTYITFDQGLFLLSTLCGSIVGALVAFLWFNIKPAKFYMWDVLSLSLWANLGIMAMLTNTLFVLVIVGLLFILNIISVVIQLTSKKLRKGKKVFKIAPFHHHLEACWWQEEEIVFRFWLIGILLSIFGVIVYILAK